MEAKIIYTVTDEAPALATRSLLPVIQAFSAAAGIAVETRDISLSGRILAAFPETVNDQALSHDALAELGDLVKQPDANVIKLPNISASIPQIHAAVKELQDKGFPVPDYPESPQSPEDHAVKARFDKVKGSAVNPVLREGNSDRRAPKAVKAYARANPHSMGAWSADSKTHVASMDHGDFYGSEKSLTLDNDTVARIEYHAADGGVQVLKDKQPLEEGEILDAAVMSRQALRGFLKDAIADAKAQGVLFSVHLKATMMKVSDPVIFGHVVSVFFEDLFTRHQDTFARLGVDSNNGLGDLEAKVDALPKDEKEAILDELAQAMDQGPELAQVDSDRGITNLHVPSDVIIDASMPAAIRIGGKMWAPDGSAKDMKACIPDRCYAGVYQAAVEFCKTNGAFDPTTMGSVSNVGLMAQKAEEYGSHDKTFVAPGSGVIRVVDQGGSVLLEQNVEEGDIYRSCQTKDASIRDWVKLAVRRARATGVPTVFWLDSDRAHDAQVLKKVEDYLPLEDTEGLVFPVMAPADACRYSMQRAKNGEDTVSVTGNVLRDYLTDLFPILELGTSAKMLSVVPLMQGGGLFETGAGGSAPKHVQQFVQEGHLRWDSLGEFLALAVSFEHLAGTFNNPTAALLGRTLDEATAKLLLEGKSPRRKVHQLDNRGSHYFLARYWAEALALQKDDPGLAQRFSGPATALAEQEEAILAELDAAQGEATDIGGYYRPDDAKADQAMRPSVTFNGIIAGII